MMTIEIKVNGNIKEVIDVHQMEMESAKLPYENKQEGWRVYLVNNTFQIRHNRNHGIRVLARLALNAIKRAKA